MAQFGDLKLDKDTHDLVIEGKDLVVIEDTPDSIVQRLKILLLSFQGEWFLNIDYGIPYYQSILRKGITQSKVDNIFRQQILDTEGVVAIISFTSTFNAFSREYSLTFSCRVTTGDIVTLEI